jgi:ribosomal protein S18 acetylase RimI-like enzyme
MESRTTISACDFSIPAHREAVAALINRYIDDEMGGGTPLDVDEQRLLVEGLRQHPTAIVLLAAAGEEYVGLLVGFENFSTFTVKNMINIHDVYVRPAYRGKSIGRKLMEGIIEEAQKRRCSRITLEVRSDNTPAQHLYNSLGFEETVPPMLYWRKYIFPANNKGFPVIGEGGGEEVGVAAIG